MDFVIALYVSGLFSMAIMGLSLLVYGRSIRRVLKDEGISQGTKNALVYLGLSGLGPIGIAWAGLYATGYVWMWIAIFFGGMSITLSQILFYDDPRGKKFSNVARILTVIAVVLNVFRVNFLIGMPFYIEAALVMTMMIFVFWNTGVLVRGTQTAFTWSLVLVLIMYVVTWLIASTRYVYDYHPEYFILQTLPFLMMAGIYASVLRPWRYIITSSLVFVSLSIGISIVYASMLSAEFYIYHFVAVAIFTGICILAPLNYFIQQAVVSKARTPIYISVVLGSLASIAATHANSWAIYITRGSTLFDDALITMDLLFGTMAVCAFLMAAASAAFSDWGYTRTKEFVIAYGTAIMIAGMPFIRGTSYMANVLYPYLLIGILAGIILFIRISWRIHKRGATTAARVFMLFIISSLSLGIAIMFSNLLEFGVALALLLLSSLTALASSPPVIARLTRRRAKPVAPTTET